VERSDVRVRGFSWLNGKDREISVASFQKRILCEGHNNELSPLDAEAKHVLETFEQIVLELQRTAGLKPPNAYRKPKTWYIDGSKFERWAAKLLVGLVCAEETNNKWHDSGTEALEPPARIVQAIFNHKEFVEPAGLHFASGYQGDLVDGLGVGPLSHPQSNDIIGGYISFGGLRFLIWLSQEPIESFSIPQPQGVISERAESQVIYRMPLLTFPIRNVVNQKLVFRWA
jgi:hypothetical protein